MDMDQNKKRSRDDFESNDGNIPRPKRFLTAYNIFFQQERSEFLKSQSDKYLLFEDVHDSRISANIASRWKQLSPDERLVFEDMAKRDMKRYQCEMDSYNKKVGDEDIKVGPNVDQGSHSLKFSAPASPMKCLKPIKSEDSKRQLTVPSKMLKHFQATEQKNYSVTSMLPNSNNTTHSPLPEEITPFLVASQKGAAVPDGTALSLEDNERGIQENNKSNYFYQPTETVDVDLSTLFADDNLCSTKKSRPTSPFNFQTSKLYGRDKHVSDIMEAYRKVGRPNSLSEMVLVAGYSGSGKSTLVQHLKNPIMKMGGNFICGKFDHFRRMEPLSAIISAFTQFCNELATKERETLHQTQVEIQEKIGSALSFLSGIIPSLCQIVQIPEAETVQVDGMGSQNMLKFLFQLFVRAIATPDHPLVLFLDDLQWADPLSLDLIESLVTDSENKSLLFVGSYRDNEVNETHPLAVKLCSIERKKVNITKIKVGDLSKEDTNEMISDILQTLPQLTQALTNAVYRKTSGNVLFTLQFLNSVCDDGFLSFLQESQQWEWDIKMIESKKVADDTVELMLRKILQLPQEIQSALKLVACLGYFCEDFVLSSMAAGDDISNFGCNDLIASLELAIKEGLMDRTGSSFKFAHDKIQLAAYSLIPENERGNMHLWIGGQVWSNKSASPDKALFIVVGQLNKGASTMKDTNQRIQLAGLNLQAAQKSKSLGAFQPAAFYLNTGISLLEKSSWVDHYDLSLQLYSACAEAEYCIGEFDEMNKKLEQVFSKARCPGDELDSFFTLIGALNAQYEVKKAIEVGHHALSRIGEPSIKSTVKSEFARTMQLMGGKADDDILSMKAMDDSHKIASMRIMYLVAHASYNACSESFPLSVLRIVQATINHGICDESAYGFAAFGVLTGTFGDNRSAYRFGQLSLRLLEKSKTKKCLPGVYAAVYAFIIPRVDHYRKSLQPLEYAYNEGMKWGDINFAIACVRQYLVHAFYCGEELSTVENLMRKYDKIAREHRQELIETRNRPDWQAILNLMGHSDDPEQLIGEVMDQEELLKEALETKRHRITSAIYHARSWLAYIFGNYDLASKMMEERRSLPSFIPPISVSCSFLFFEGLISFAMAHKTGENKWSVTAHECTREMKEYALSGPANCQHKLLLLQAESASLAGENDTAEQRYNHAISTASKNGFVQDQALAYERAGIFHSKLGNNSVSSMYYNQAHDAYLKWGACCKAELLSLQLASLPV